MRQDIDFARYEVKILDNFGLGIVENIPKDAKQVLRAIVPNSSIIDQTMKARGIVEAMKLPSLMSVFSEKIEYYVHVVLKSDISLTFNINMLPAHDLD